MAEFFAGRKRHLSESAKSNASSGEEVLNHGISVHYFFKFAVWRKVEGPQKSLVHSRVFATIGV